MYVAGFLKGAAYVLFLAAGLLGFVVDLMIVNKAAGFWGVVIGIFIFPVTFAAAPWYALIAWHNWYPLLIEYGSGIVAAVMYAIGDSLEERYQMGSEASKATS